jgi:cytoskeletal protein RodZ
MEHHPIDKIFKDGLGDRNMQPKRDLWSEIDETLHADKKEKKIFQFKPYSIAAAMVGILCAAWILWPTDASIQSIDTPIVQEENINKPEIEKSTTMTPEIGKLSTNNRNTTPANFASAEANEANHQAKSQSQKSIKNQNEIKGDATHREVKHQNVTNTLAGQEVVAVQTVQNLNGQTRESVGSFAVAVDSKQDMLQVKGIQIKLKKRNKVDVNGPKIDQVNVAYREEKIASDSKIVRWVDALGDVSTPVITAWAERNYSKELK